MTDVVEAPPVESPIGKTRLLPITILAPFGKQGYWRVSLPGGAELFIDGESYAALEKRGETTGGETTSPEVAEIAGRGLANPKKLKVSEIKTLCASALTQARDHD